MKRRFILFSLPLILYGLQGLAQSPDYNIASIPDNLLSHANAVVRDAETSIDIRKPDAVWITCKKVITILNPNGKSLGAIEVYYNKSRPVQDISGALYDADGKLIKKLKKSDFEDLNAAQDFSLFEDFRVKRLVPDGYSYPYTIEYQYTQKYKFTLYLPDWTPLDDYGESVQRASLNISSPDEIPMRYKNLQVSSPEIDSLSEKGWTTYQWKLTNFSALQDEPYGPPLFQTVLPIVILSPEHFEYYGMTGDFSNWKEYGQWVYGHLLNGRDKLPDATIAYVREMTKGMSSPVDIARKIYEYAQQKNRYVAIEIGKGGFIPMTASEVDKVSYGDCKALVNYTMALLKAVHIPSYYTEVNAGSDGMSLLSGFASAGQGNHVILCVPFKKDTVWLECTNKYIPFGYLGSFTDNRNVVICAPAGGVLTRTPAYADDTNIQERNAHLFIDSAGNLTGNMNTFFRGLLYQKRASWENRSHADQIRHANDTYSFLQMNITSYHLTFMKDEIPSVEENLSFTSPRYAAPSGKGLNIPLNPVNRFQDIPPLVNNRRNKVYIAHGFTQTDSLIFNFPEGYMLSVVPPESKIKNMFGEYMTTIKAEGEKLLYVRHFNLKSGYYPAQSYGAFVKFLQQAATYDQEMFMISHP